MKKQKQRKRMGSNKQGDLIVNKEEMQSTGKGTVS